MSGNDDVRVGSLMSLREALSSFGIMTLGMGATLFVCFGVVEAFGRWTQTEFLTALLKVTGQAASWVVPLYVTALVAALAVFILPDWEDRASKSSEVGQELAVVRRVIGIGAFFVGPAYAVWILLVLIAAMVPGVPVGGNGGVVMALPLVLMLPVLISRAAVGTLEQRYEEAVREGERLRAWQGQVRKLTYRQNITSGWGFTGLAAGVLVTLMGLVGAVIYVLYDWSEAISVLLALVVIHGFVASLWASRYSAPSRSMRWFLAMSAILGLSWSITVVVLLQIPLPLKIVTLAGIGVPALLYLIPWGGKQLLAGTATGGLEKRIEIVDEYRRRSELELKRRQPWWRRVARRVI